MIGKAAISFDDRVLEAVVALAPNAYAVTIQDYLAARHSYRWRWQAWLADTGWWPAEPSLGAVYESLARLEGIGLTQSRWGLPLPERGNRRRLFFAPVAKPLVTKPQAEVF